MKVHATVGADILKSIDFPYPVEPIVRHQSRKLERLAGTRAGLRDREIPLGARILSVVDCYDALTSDRPYRPRDSREHAEQVPKERRASWYDPWIVDEFLRILDKLERLDAEDVHGSISESSMARSTPKAVSTSSPPRRPRRESLMSYGANCR